MTKPFDQVRLSTVANVITGYAFSSQDLNDNNKDVPVLKIANVTSPVATLAFEDHFPREKVSNRIAKYYLRERDVLVAMTGMGSVGRVSVVRGLNREVLLNQRVGAIRAKQNCLDQNFLGCVLTAKHYEQTLYDLGIGAGQPNVSPKDIRKLPVPLPSLTTQKKIAAVLTAYDELIENNKRRIALLEKVAEEIYREWFVRFRFPGREKVKFVRVRPANWVRIRFGEMVMLIMGQSPPSSTYNESGDGLPFHQGVGTYGERFPKKKTFCTVEGRKARKGDILFSVRAPVGRLNIADSEMIIGRGLAALRHKRGYNSYLYYLLKVTFANEDIIGNGSIFNSVGKDELAKFEVVEPDEHLVKLFEEHAAQIDKQIAALALSAELLTKTRDLLLPRLISGKLSVENLDIQFPPGMTEELAQNADPTHHA